MIPALDQRNLPPMLAQYLDFKTRYNDCLLLFQVGDFYELFFEDAVTVSRTLNLTLTSRDKNTPDPIPMCGVPVAVVENYIERLVAVGYSVALVSQQAVAPGTKGMVNRKLDRIVTPGIKIMAGATTDASESIVASIYPEAEGDVSIAFSDIQTATIYVREGLTISDVQSELLKIGAVEVILPKLINGKPLDRRLSWVRNLSLALGESAIKNRAESYYQLGDSHRNFPKIQGYSALSTGSKKAVRLLTHYIDETTVDTKLEIAEISLKGFEGTLGIDATTRANLELIKNSRDGGQAGTLFNYMNHTVTPGGAKLLKNWILAPLLTIAEIKERHTAVMVLKNSAARQNLQELLKFIADIERIAARIELKIATPRELGALRDALLKVPAIKEVIQRSFLKGDKELSLLLESIEQQLEVPQAALQRLVEALIEIPPYVTNEGGIIRTGYCKELDELQAIKADGTSWIGDLEARERAASGIGSLKIRFNNVIGYYIEITKTHLSKIPQHYIRKQSMVNGERFTTPELKEREAALLGAESKLIELERKLFEELRTAILPQVAEFRRLALLLSTIDVLAALAELAEREDLVEPELVETPEFIICDSKHPIVAKLLQGKFIANSLLMPNDEKRCAIVTGPNMGGKSTYLRQIALIVIMAQLGSFVPAKQARIGIVDRIFARLGASDNIAEGESTFMVEMREAAHIMAHATERSLLLIDEIGRGTATADGLAIAQAILEWIVTQLRSRTLFATHFYELTELEDIYLEVENLSVGSVDRGGEVIFTHEICKGRANRSYGIEVAKLAGLPANLLGRARELLALIDESKHSKGNKKTPQLSLFNKTPYSQTVAEPQDYQYLKNLENKILNININEITPIEALNILSATQRETKTKNRV